MPQCLPEELTEGCVGIKTARVPHRCRHLCDPDCRVPDNGLLATEAETDYKRTVRMPSVLS